MKEELIDKIIKDLSDGDIIEIGENNLRLYLKEILSNKVLVDKDKIEKLIEKWEGKIYNEGYVITEFLVDLTDLLDNK